jgi:hypothetical protein
VGRNIVNRAPFDTGGALTPAELLIASADRVGPGRHWRLRKNGMGFEANLDTGDIAVNPVPGYWGDKRIVFRTGVALDWRQMDDHTIELFKETPNVRYSFVIWKFGFKFHFLVREGYSGAGEFRVPFILQGLTRQGRNIVDPSSGKTVLRVQDAFMIPLVNDGGWRDMLPHEQQALGLPRDCVEFEDNGEFVIQADLAGLGSLFERCVIDPSVTFDENNGWKDSAVIKYYPHNNFGLQISTWTVQWTINPNHTYRTAVAIDTTAIPQGATVTSALLNEKVSHASDRPVVPGTVLEYVVLTEDFEEGVGTKWNYGSCGACCDHQHRNHGTGLYWASIPDLDVSPHALPKDDGGSFGPLILANTDIPTYDQRNPNRYAGGTHTWKQNDIRTGVQYAVDRDIWTRYWWCVNPGEPHQQNRWDCYMSGANETFVDDRPYLDVTYDDGGTAGRNEFQVAGVGRRRSSSAVPESQAIGTMRRVFHG